MRKYCECDTKIKLEALNKLVADGWKVTTETFINYNRCGKEVGKSTVDMINKNGVNIQLRDLWLDVKN